MIVSTIIHSTNLSQMSSFISDVLDLDVELSNNDNSFSLMLGSHQKLIFLLSKTSSVMSFSLEITKEEASELLQRAKFYDFRNGPENLICTEKSDTLIDPQGNPWNIFISSLTES